MKKEQILKKIYSYRTILLALIIYVNIFKMPAIDRIDNQFPAIIAILSFVIFILYTVLTIRHKKIRGCGPFNPFC